MKNLLMNIAFFLAFVAIIIGIPALLDRIDYSTKTFIIVLIVLLIGSVAFLVVKKIIKVFKKLLTK